MKMGSRACRYRVVMLVLMAMVTISSFTLTVTEAKEKQTQMYEPNESEAREGINLRVAFPSNSKAVNVTCKTGGFFSLRNVQSHTWEVPIDTVETCQALWGHSEADIVAFDPNADLGHVLVFWFAKFDGFFHSYDNVTWEKRASWNH